jgi:NADH:ubiquinone oxidoreductase subunit
MINFLKQIFTWWYKQTIGTFIYTLIFGKFVGSDKFGNKYYLSSKGKRWVIYKSNIEATKIPPEWHLWIHSTIANIPSNKITKFNWQIEHTENLTGTEKAYKPEGSLTYNSRKNTKKYETWKN